MYTNEVLQFSSRLQKQYFIKKKKNYCENYDILGLHLSTPLCILMANHHKEF